MRILAIETSCDETSLALIEASGGLSQPQFKILKHLIASQIKIHQPFGGVVPNLAKREHLKNLPILFKKIATRYLIPDTDLIAVTVGPGLEPCLWAGIEFAKQMYADQRRPRAGRTPRKKKKIKLIGVNHLNGHLYSYLLSLKSYALFPAIALIISGGHTILLLMKDLKTIKKLGETRDDAVGETFDKAARLLKLPYPGGPEIEKLARSGNPDTISFPRPMINQKNYDFSFSGLKTSVLYYLRDFGDGIRYALLNRVVEAEQRGIVRGTTRKNIGVNQRFNQRQSASMADVAASFQQAAFDVLIVKTIRAVKEFNAKAIIVSGGVAANRELRRRFKKESSKFKNLKLLIPDFQFCADNAAMIGAAGYIYHSKSHIAKSRQERLEAQGNLTIK